MRNSYSEEDVEFLLKDITLKIHGNAPAENFGQMEYQAYDAGEKIPTRCVREYNHAISNYAKSVADNISVLAEKIYRSKGRNAVIVSVVGESTPVGVLIHRYLKTKYHVQSKHYSIAMIEKYGLDHKAMNYVLDKHKSETIQFVCCAAGDSTVYRRLSKELSKYSGIALPAAVFDPEPGTEIFGTCEDILIPTVCLNSAASGLVSKPFLPDDDNTRESFYGAVYISELEQYDFTNNFIHNIEKYFNYYTNIPFDEYIADPQEPVISQKIFKEYRLGPNGRVAFGIGETIRELLMNVPDRIIINPKYRSSVEMELVFQLANEKGIPYELASVELGNYKVCGIITELSKNRNSDGEDVA